MTLWIFYKYIDKDFVENRLNNYYLQTIAQKEIHTIINNLQPKCSPVYRHILHYLNNL